ncbi:probable disease resistance protein At5g45490 [Corylus avellana]|uniref:probable disease resistance protein At5g45490 n=1 Tax=Corylus avellana TaxID=13451 RepID=UPI00286CFE37|nr:probable disease resistance protein At5g45490 [Corylus avellana]
MLERLGVEEEIINNYKVDQEHNLKELLYAFHLQLQGKRYLIVFDDARVSSTCDGKWDALAYGLPKGCGGAVIVTSRNEEIAKKMVGREGILHLVLPLSEPESCWSIFKEAAEQDFIPSDAEIQKREIFKRCAGLPLTAKMMGGIIKKQPPEGGTPKWNPSTSPAGSREQLQMEAINNSQREQLQMKAINNSQREQL